MKNFKPNESMLHNYIQNKLSPKETEELELWLADHPDVMKDLELDLMFKQAQYKPPAAEIKAHKSSLGWLNFMTGRKLIPVHIMAYGLLAMLMISTINNTNQIQTSAATFIELEKQRGSDANVMEVQASAQKSLVVRLFPDSMTEKYNLIMQSDTSDHKIEFKDLIADDLGSITVTLNSKNTVGKWEVLLLRNTKIIEQQYSIEIANDE